jgi:hypothetical protein
MEFQEELEQLLSHRSYNGVEDVQVKNIERRWQN